MRSSLPGLAKNAFEVLSKLPRHGVGSKLAKTTWGEGSHYNITSVKVSKDGAHGKAFGVLTWNGKAQDERELRISGTLKRVWRAAGPSAVQQQPATSLAATALRQENAAAAAAAGSNGGAEGAAGGDLAAPASS